MNNISNSFIFFTTTYMFRTVPPSVKRDSKTVRTASGISYTSSVAACLQTATVPVWHDAVCTVLDSWWWTKIPTDTCRVLFENKINLSYFISVWFPYRHILRCTVQQTSNIDGNIQPRLIVPSKAYHFAIYYLLYTSALFVFHPSFLHKSLDLASHTWRKVSFLSSIWRLKWISVHSTSTWQHEPVVWWVAVWLMITVE